MDTIFTEDFKWGAATASYQIEGAYDEDGRGLSVWDVFSRRPGKIMNNDNGDIACDHYHRYKEDVRIMKEMGLNAYRFSIAWPRILPTGEGKINRKGIDFYNRLIDELLENNIEPFITLFHWDLPQALEEKYGGWRSKTVSKLFAEYAGIVVKEYSDRVKYWATMNEIICFTYLAHELDKHAPGGREPRKVTNQTIHNALLGHGLAYTAIRQNAKKEAKIGLVEVPGAVFPIYDAEEHIEAARKAFFDKNQAILFPLMTGKYNEELVRLLGADMPDYNEEEMKIISQPLDYIGYNNYFGTPIRAAQNEKGYEEVDIPSSFPKTEMGWVITPRALYYILKFSNDFFPGLPIYITENGIACDDRETEGGEILDIDRIEYLRNHLQQCKSAINEGIPLKGYFVWSLLDNFEWSWGYSRRFGIVRVNYSNMARTIKLSGRYYSGVIKSGRVL